MLGERVIEMQPSGRVVFGRGTVSRVGEVVREAGASRVFLVSDPGLAASGLPDVVRAGLDLPVETYDRVTPNPATGDIEAGSEALRGFGLRGTVVLAVGGGSSLDAAKGIALHAPNDLPVPALDFRAEGVRAGLPVVAVPTTAGTGSETNHFGVVTDPDGPRKIYIGHPSVRPRATVLDPLLTVELPPGPTAATGMDAMVHALEALVSRNANPYADGVALQVIGMVNRWLPVAVSDGEDVEARSQMLLASHMAGLAFSSGTGLGLCHAIAHSISSHTGAVHGAALAAVLPRVMEFNLPAASGKLARAARPLGVWDPTAPEVSNARAAVSALEDLARGVFGRRTPVGEMGVTEGLVPRLVEDTLSDLVLGNTPRMPSAEDVRKVLAAS